MVLRSCATTMATLGCSRAAWPRPGRPREAGLTLLSSPPCASTSPASHRTGTASERRSGGLAPPQPACISEVASRSRARAAACTGRDRSRCGSEPISTRNSTDLGAELDRSRGRGGEADGRRGRRGGRHVVRTVGLGRRRLRGRARGRHCEPAAGARTATCTLTAAPQAPRPQLFTISGPSSGSAQHAQCHIHQHSTEITENSGRSYCRQLPEDSPPTATQAGSWLFPTGFSSPSSRSRSFGGRIPDPRSPTAWTGP